MFRGGLRGETDDSGDSPCKIFFEVQVIYQVFRLFFASIVIQFLGSEMTSRSLGDLKDLHPNERTPNPWVHVSMKGEDINEVHGSADLRLVLLLHSPSDKAFLRI